MSVFIIFILFLSINGCQVYNKPLAEVNSSKTSKQMTISLPIVITEDEDFLSYSFQGLGIESNPYIIENLTIEDKVKLVNNKTTSKELIKKIIEEDDINLKMQLLMSSKAIVDEVSKS